MVIVNPLTSQILKSHLETQFKGYFDWRERKGDAADTLLEIRAIEFPADDAYFLAGPVRFQGKTYGMAYFQYKEDCKPIAQIEAELAAFSDYSAERPIWLDIEVISQHYLNDVQRHIQQLVEPLPVEVVLLRRSKDLTRQSIQRQARETLSELTVNEVFERRLALDEPQTDDQQQRQQRIKHLFLNLADSLADNQNKTAQQDDKTGGLLK